MMHLRSRSGMSLIETLVVVALGSVVFGLILNTLILTQRESDRLTATELMHQEALLISQTIERNLRFRISPEDLEGQYAGGAGPEISAAGGAITTSTLPASIAAVTSSTLSETTAGLAATGGTTSPERAAPAHDRIPASSTADFTSVPASIQSILGTTSTAAASTVMPTAANGSLQTSAPIAAASPVVVKRETSGQERFAADEVVLYSLGGGPDPGKMVVALRNSRGIGSTPSHAFIEQSPTGGAFAPASRRRALGPNADKFQSQISFRYANVFDGPRARWARESREVPRLIEYTVRVWPVGAGDSFEQAQQSQNVTPVFQLTSAMALQ